MVTIFAASASAKVVSVTIGWAPSGQTITGYQIHVGSSAGEFEQHFNVGMPNIVSGAMRAELHLEDSQNNFIAISSYDAFGRQTPFSEALLVLAAASETEPTPEPEQGPTPGPTPADPSAESGTPEEISERAANSGAMGMGARVDDVDAYQGLPARFKRSKADRKRMATHVAYGTEYGICDLEGDGITDLVMTNLYSLAKSRRMHREAGRIIITSRSPDGSLGAWPPGRSRFAQASSTASRARSSRITSPAVTSTATATRS
jgi:hypothetical protein